MAAKIKKKNLTFQVKKTTDWKNKRRGYQFIESKYTVQNYSNNCKLHMKSKNKYFNLKKKKKKRKKERKK
jgi:hypothetical protein